MTRVFNESIEEDAALIYFGERGYVIDHGLQVAIPYFSSCAPRCWMAGKPRITYELAQFNGGRL